MQTRRIDSQSWVWLVLPVSAPEPVTHHNIPSSRLISDFIVVAGGVTVFSLGDMILYNRRKRKAFFEEQNRLLQERLAEARQANARGTADDDQMLLLNRIRAADEAEAERRNRPSVWKSFKGLFTTKGLMEEDTHGRPQSENGSSEGAKLLGAQDKGSIPEEAPARGGAVLQAVEEKRREEGREIQRRKVEGGVLDKLAEQAASTVTRSDKRSWTGWFSSR